MSTPDLVVDLELGFRRGRTVERRRARHVLRGRVVHVVDRVGAVPRVLDVAAWRGELAAACRATAPEEARTCPGDGATLPWDLVVGTGAALAARRPDLYAELAARADPGVRDDLARLHSATVGRLRAVGTLPGRHRVGWVSWVLLTDGWRAFTPCTDARPSGVRPMLRLERREPADLAHDVARWAAGR